MKKNGKHVTIHATSLLNGKCHGWAHLLVQVHHQSMLRKQTECDRLYAVTRVWQCCGQSCLVDLASLVALQMMENHIHRIELFSIWRCLVNYVDILTVFTFLSFAYIRNKFGKNVNVQRECDEQK